MRKQLTSLISFTMWFAAQFMSFHSIRVSGLIYDQSGKAIPGKNVFETGSANSAIGLNFY